MRLRLETSKKLRALGSKKQSQRVDAQAKGHPIVVDVPIDVTKVRQEKLKTAAINTRTPRVKKATLASAPVPKAKFRKRQINKTWLPTHMFHAKRARMSPPTDPLWRFAIPMTPTAKCYRPTHRAASERGAIAWDISYMSTLGLEGQQQSIEGVLKAVGVGSHPDSEKVWSGKGQKWRNGTRVWEGIVFERESPHSPIAPVVVLWSALGNATQDCNNEDRGSRKRKIFIRTHPSAFSQLWEEMVRLSKIAKPQVSVEDLRFQIGSIEVTGPGSTETLLGALWPSPPTGGSEHGKSSVESTWQALAGLTNPAGLPAGTMLAFDVQDPRLHHPPRRIKIPDTADDHQKLLELTTSWPVDSAQSTPSIFDRQTRLSASSKLQSQKSINRRRAYAPPGQFPEPAANDPRIPSLLYCTPTANGKQGKWTVLLPWKCVQPVWYSVMYYPLSTGGQPRFGGITERRQLSFETGTPCFPENFPGTKAGLQWEMHEREKRHAEWKRRPKSKRVSWEAVDLGDGKKGEIGDGWACDWHRLVHGPGNASQDGTETMLKTNVAGPAKHTMGTDGDPSVVSVPAQPLQLSHHSAAEAYALLSSARPMDPDTNTGNPLANVRIQFLNRGVPQTCARIYRLPASAPDDLRRRWLALHPSNQAELRHRGPKNSLPRLPKNAPVDVMQQRLANAHLNIHKVGDSDYPVCPSEDDLIGFVTSGNFNLGEGQGTGIGAILLKRVQGDGAESRLCIVRNAGNGVGRLARWDIV